MLKSIQNRDKQGNRWIKLTMGALLVLISLSMLTYLIPGLGTSAMSNSPDAAASVGGEQITVADVQKQLNTALRGQDVPPMLRGLYAKQVLDQMVFQHALEIEGQRLGISVTPEEMTQRIKQILPTAWNGDMWLKDRYTTEVQTRLGMTVEDFERFLRDQMLQEKFHQLVTDSITVSPEEVQQEFRRRNEKVQIDYALVKPADLGGIDPTHGRRLDRLFHQEHVASIRYPRSAPPTTRCSILRSSRATVQVSRRGSSGLLQRPHRRIQSRKPRPRRTHSVQDRRQDRRRNRRNPAEGRRRPEES